MPQQNLDLIRRIYEDDLLDRNPDEILAFASANIEYVNPPEAVDPGVRSGRSEVAQGLRNISGTFDSTRHELRELFEAGDCVVAAVEFHARGGGSAIEVVQERGTHLDAA